jgi:hypothetical protein
MVVVAASNVDKNDKIFLQNIRKISCENIQLKFPGSSAAGHFPALLPSMDSLREHHLNNNTRKKLTNIVTHTTGN